MDFGLTSEMGGCAPAAPSLPGAAGNSVDSGASFHDIIYAKAAEQALGAAGQGSSVSSQTETEVVMPPELEAKMKENPQLAQSVKENIAHFIAVNDSFAPECKKSFRIVLDKEGSITQYSIKGEGRIRCQYRREKEAYEAQLLAKRRRRERSRILAEAYAIKRKLQEQELNECYYENAMERKALLESIRQKYL